MSQYFIGIDLGTTHSAVFYAPKNGAEVTIEQLMIPQLVAAGQVKSMPLLPSFVYYPHASEFLDSDLILPWGKPNAIIGQLARQQGAKSAGRMVQSAKSWLCHSRVNADEKLLPIDALPELDKVSPAQITENLLAHLVNSWDHAFPDSPMAQQDVVITVPASFDPAARVITEQAAQTLGLNARLIEEPLAAFYAWLGEQNDWKQSLALDDQVLVLDVGGGTTDLSLIQVVEEDGSLNLERIAVGRHILLGGDNMDMALTYHLAAQLAQSGTQLEAWQVSGLTQACREAKERILSNDGLQEVSVVVPSRGRSLFNKSITATLSRDEVNQLIVNGFFPESSLGERAHRAPRSGVSSLNLDYESDPAITRHISEFISQHNAKPSKILLNGGVFNAEPIRSAVEEQLIRMLDNPELGLLKPAHLDYAVAKGAVFYRATQEQGGVKVKNGLAANYYIGVASPMPAIPGMLPPVDALCVAPFGLEEGADEVMLANEFSLLVGEPVEFRFFRSNQGEEGKTGEVVSSFALNTLTELAPLNISLEAGHYAQGDMVRVYLSARVTELGLLVLEAHDTQSELSWTIEFVVRES